MEIKKVIDGFIENNMSVLKSISEFMLLFKEREDADEILLKITNTIEKTNYNLAYGTYFTSFLQLASSHKIISQYDLEDIEELLQSLLLLEDFNLELYAETARFEWSVMDDKEEAKDVIKLGLEKAEEKIRELKDLLKEIESE